MSFLSRLFHDEHRCNYKQVGTVNHSSHINPWSASPNTAKIFRCKCGNEYRRLTPAGEQQLDWGDDYKHLVGLVDCERGLVTIDK